MSTSDQAGASHRETRSYERLRFADDYPWLPQWPRIVTRAFALVLWAGTLFLCFYGKLFFIVMIQRRPLPSPGTNIGGPVLGMALLASAALWTKVNRGRLSWIRRQTVRLYALWFIHKYRRRSSGSARTVALKGTVRVTSGSDASHPAGRLVVIQAGSRTLFVPRIHLVFESVSEFDLVIESGEVIRVRPDGTYLIASRKGRRMSDLDSLGRDIAAAEATGEVAGCFGRIRHAEEVELRGGDSIEVLGVLDDVIDPEVERLARDAPVRSILRAGEQTPFLIVLR